MKNSKLKFIELGKPNVSQKPVAATLKKLKGLQIQEKSNNLTWSQRLFRDLFRIFVENNIK